MIKKTIGKRERSSRFFAVARASCLGVAISAGMSGAALAYVGNSFIDIPGTSGQWQGDDFKDWIRAEAHYWPNIPLRRTTGPDRMTIGGPGGPKEGSADILAFSLTKGNPGIEPLMALCADKTTIPELTYAESSEQSRPVNEKAPRPADVPEYWLYTLKDAQVSECPVVDEAPDQAFVIKFNDIEWVNYDSDGPELIAVTLEPEDYPDVRPADQSSPGQTKAFVVSWFGVAGYVSDDQCPVMNRKPTEDDYYALMSKEQAAKRREEFGEMGVDYGRYMGYRGPNELSVAYLPGIVRDPGFAEPVSTMAHGLALDAAKVPENVCPQKTYDSIDGRISGVNNQLFTVVGCFDGYRGKHGYRNQTPNARRGDGNITTLIEISGIDDEMNDDDVDVKIIYSADSPVRDPAGSMYLPYSTFRVSTEPQFAYYNKQFKGHIVDGVVVTEPISYFVLNGGIGSLLIMHEVQLRLEIQPDGTLKGDLGGYMDWRRFMTYNRSSYSENLFGFQTPGLYNALRRNADGLKDPVTGECNGISAAYEIDAVPAFIAPVPSAPGATANRQ